jgi:hypothetical protein
LEPIEIIGAAQSAYVRTTRMAFEEKGVAYSLKPAAPNSTTINALHPFGKIPVMRHGAFTLFESKAIATYIWRTISFGTSQHIRFERASLIPYLRRSLNFGGSADSAHRSSRHKNPATFVTPTP